MSVCTCAGHRKANMYRNKLTLEDRASVRAWAQAIGKVTFASVNLRRCPREYRGLPRTRVSPVSVEVGTSMRGTRHYSHSTIEPRMFLIIMTTWSAASSHPQIPSWCG